MTLVKKKIYKKGSIQAIGKHLRQFREKFKKETKPKMSNRGWKMCNLALQTAKMCNE